MKNKLVLFGLLMVLVIVVGGCVPAQDGDEKEREDVKELNLRNYNNDAFFIQFDSNHELEGIKASLSDRNFKLYFDNEVKTLFEIVEADGIDIDYHENSNLVYIKIKYVEKITEKKKYEKLDELLDMIKKKWYVKNIQYDTKDYLTGAKVG